MEASVLDTSNNGVQQHDEHDDTNEETPIPTPLKEQQPFFVMDWLVDMVGDDQRSHRLARLIELQSRKFVLNRQRIDRDIVASVRKLEKQRRISHLIKIRTLLDERIEGNDAYDPDDGNVLLTTKTTTTTTTRTTIEDDELEDETKEGQVIVDYMCQNLSEKDIVEECLGVLKYWIVVEPSLNEVSLVSIVLQAMRNYPESTTLQTKGMQLLWSILSSGSAANRHEVFCSEGGLNVVLAAMKDHPDTLKLALHGMLILKDFTRRSVDFQRAVFAKGGISVVLGKTRRYSENYAVVEAAMACMRNLCLNQDNLVHINTGIPTLLEMMDHYPNDAAIQAYGCDALGRLATETNNQITLLDIDGIQAAARAMFFHPNHAGVQDRACFLLFNMMEYPPALKEMQRTSNKLMPALNKAKLPPKEASRARLETLKRRVGGWFVTLKNPLQSIQTNMLATEGLAAKIKAKSRSPVSVAEFPPSP